MSCGWDIIAEFVTADAEFASVLGWITASSDTAESEGWQMKQCWIKYIKNPKSPLFNKSYLWMWIFIFSCFYTLWAFLSSTFLWLKKITFQCFYNWNGMKGWNKGRGILLLFKYIKGHSHRLNIELDLPKFIWAPCALGCSDFDFFHILRYNHPSLTP